MVMREFRGRYLGSLLGGIWSILNPAAMIFIYTIIFSKIMQARLVGSEDTLAYGVYLCSGLLAWNYFSELLIRCQTIFIEQSNMIKKLNFPRITLPVILFFSSTLNFIIVFSIFLLFLLVVGRFPGAILLGYIPLLVLQQAIALGLGMMLGTMNIFFRDIGQFMGIVIQFWFWLTPIVYPVSILSERVQAIITFNPMTRIMASYQQIVLNQQWPVWREMYPQFILAAAALVFGLFVFRRLSGDAVDEL